MKKLVYLSILLISFVSCGPSVKDVEEKVCDMIENQGGISKSKCKDIQLEEAGDGKFIGTVTTEKGGTEMTYNIEVEVDGNRMSYSMKNY